MKLLQRHKEIGCATKAFELPLVIRVNTLKTNEQDLIEALEKQGVQLSKIEWLPLAYTAAADFSLASTKEYLLGQFYIQEAASQVPALILYPKEGQTVLDMCASPGSKTTQLAALMNNTGTIIALDIGQRVTKLTYNLERCAVTNTAVYKHDARFFLTGTQQVDAILLDAPCAGNFMIEENWYEKRSLLDIKSRTMLQKELFKHAVNLLKKGGTLVYSTCSLEPEEDEEIIDWALQRLPVDIVDVDFPLGQNALESFGKKTYDPKVSKAKRFHPKNTQTQGFFVAKLIKK